MDGASDFSKAPLQLGLGVLLGSLPGVSLVGMGAADMNDGVGPSAAAAATGVIALFIFAVTVMACVVPVRWALRIHPADAPSAENQLLGAKRNQRIDVARPSRREPHGEQRHT
jgi:hypothetical protein